mmetsp:Transcript_1886/g.6214  ORF Transcript_1886/g.6214 Transcript_1886/m.6214 type:complete len:233 (-) Transcript_1886:1170-1868(-)
MVTTGAAAALGPACEVGKNGADMLWVDMRSDALPGAAPPPPACPIGGGGAPPTPAAPPARSSTRSAFARVDLPSPCGPAMATAQMGEAACRNATSAAGSSRSLPVSGSARSKGCGGGGGAAAARVWMPTAATDASSTPSSASRRAEGGLIQRDDGAAPGSELEGSVYPRSGPEPLPRPPQPVESPEPGPPPLPAEAGRDKPISCGWALMSGTPAASLPLPGPRDTRYISARG